MTITGKEAFEMIMDAKAVVLNEALIQPKIMMEDPGEYTLELSYSDKETDYDYSFSWADSDQIKIEDNYLFVGSGKNTHRIKIIRNNKITDQAVVVSAQFLVKLPEGLSYQEAEDFGCEWLTNLDTDCLDYRHPRVMGVYIRPVPVIIKDMEAEDIFTDNNLSQL